jgi:cytochrome P450
MTDHGDHDSPEYRRLADPRSYFGKLRAKGPVDFEEGYEGRLQVLKIDDADVVLRDHETWSSGMGANHYGNARPLIPLQIDPPDHVRYRRLLDPVFAPRSIAGLEADVVALTNGLIDGFVADGGCDLSEDFSVPLPSAIFLRLLGLPQADLPGFLKLKDSLIRPEGPTEEARLEVRTHASAEVYDLFRSVLAERRTEPRDDIVTRLAQAEIEGSTLSDEEILDICHLLLMAGLDTVSISLQCMFLHLATHPEHRRELTDDLSLTSNVVEELLRWEAPVMGVTRYATRDTRLGGHDLPEGTRAQVMLASLTTDPDTAEGYDRVDFHRQNNRHLAFGGGPHRCLGSHLARLELRTAIHEWHRRIPDYGLAPGAEITWSGPMLRTIDHLPLVWQAA